MEGFWQRIVAASSIVLRVSAFAFLRWIPGHHFPPVILSALAVYLSIIFLKQETFRPALRVAYPGLLSKERVKISLKDRTDIVETTSVAVDYHDPVIYQDEQSYWKVLLLGVPDWTEKQLSYVTIGCNILITLLMLDMVFRGPWMHYEAELRFSRVGYLDSTSAKVLLREPDNTQLPIHIYLKREDEFNWKRVATIDSLGNSTDYTHPVLFDGLYPETYYAYQSSNRLNGTFKTTAVAGSAGSNRLTFLTSSCIKANFPYNPFSHSLTIHGFQHLSKLIQAAARKPEFMLFLGDFIYVDVPRRLGASVSHYRSEYRRVYASPSWNLPGLRSLPWLHTLDDHEIANDWSGGNETQPFPEASDPFMHYHVSVNPPLPKSSSPRPNLNTTYFEFTQGPASFFMLDTRRYRTDPEDHLQGQRRSLTAKPLYGDSDRSSNPPSQNQASILGDAQREALREFILRPEPAHVHWKIIASSVPFTKNWRFGTSDTWGGYLSERAEILAYMHEAESLLGIRIIILSGDRHEFAAIRYPARLGQGQNIEPERATESRRSPQSPNVYDSAPQAGPHEFSVGPLSMFYLPFRTFRQIDEEDQAITYLPDGNSKVGVINIENLIGHGRENRGWFNFGQRPKYDGPRSLLKYSLWIDGEVKWEYTLTSPPPASD